MEDYDLLLNLDWDPLYLASIFDEDFNDMSYLRNLSCSLSDVQVSEALDTVEKMTNYCPVTEEISMDDSVLHDTVKQIEKE